MRNAFINELVSLAEKKPQIALVVGDLGYSVVEPFADRFPDRFINAGVAEQNMTGLAAGMASEGYHVFTYSIANFPTFRCAEQIRNDIDYHRLAVTIVSVGGGLSYGNLGYSHHAVQDYALMRSFPNTLIAAPGDPLEVRACLRYLIENPGPSYLRLGKAGEPNFHNDVPAVIEPGLWLKIREPLELSRGSSSKRALLSTGATLGIAVDWQRSNHRDHAVFSMPLWSMASGQNQFGKLNEFAEIRTVEDHILSGGFGSWMLESKARTNNPHPHILPIALDSLVCGHVASQVELNRLGGLLPR